MASSYTSEGYPVLYWVCQLYPAFFKDSKTSYNLYLGSGGIIQEGISKLTGKRAITSIVSRREEEL
jgi:hypothetical protein